MARVSDKRWREKKKNSTREIPPSAELNSLSLLPCWQCNICVGVQQLSLAVCSYRHHAFSVRMYACLYPPPNYTCQTPRDLAQEETFFFFLPPPLYNTYAGTVQAERCLSLTLPSHLSHPLNSSSTPVLCVSPSHTPPFAPSNYNSIHRSFAVTMATAMLGTGPRVTSLPLTINIYCIKINLTNHVYVAYRRDANRGNVLRCRTQSWLRSIFFQSINK